MRYQSRDPTRRCKMFRREWVGYLDKTDHGQNRPDNADHVSGQNGPRSSATDQASGQNGPHFWIKQTLF